jgi:hypothetical protein
MDGGPSHAHTVDGRRHWGSSDGVGPVHTAVCGRGHLPRKLMPKGAVMFHIRELASHSTIGLQVEVTWTLPRTASLMVSE